MFVSLNRYGTDSERHGNDLDSVAGGASMKGAAGPREKSWGFVLSGGASSPPYPKLGDVSAATVLPRRPCAVSFSVLSERKLTHLQCLGHGARLGLLADLPVELRQLLPQQIQPRELPVHFPTVGVGQLDFFQERPPLEAEG